MNKAKLVLQFLKGDWKTSATAFLSLVAMFLFAFNFIDEKQFGIIMAAIVTLVGALAKDAKNNNNKDDTGEK